MICWEMPGVLELQLQPSQVPAFPVAGTDSDQLRWLLFVMNCHDSRLPFVAGLFEHSLSRHLSRRQLDCLLPIMADVRKMYDLGQLDCQAGGEHPERGVEE
jgi:hypothetical protein